MEIIKKQENISRKDLAMQYFLEGYNCTQSVVLAFADLIPMEKNALLCMVSPLGGGMGRLREVCGCVSGMFLVLGALNGYADPKDTKKKAAVYADVQKLAAEFEELNHSIICRELLQLNVKKEEPTPEVRSKEYYKKRPCKELVGMAAEMIENYLGGQNA